MRRIYAFSDLPRTYLVHGAPGNDARPHPSSPPLDAVTVSQTM